MLLQVPQSLQGALQPAALSQAQAADDYFLGENNSDTCLGGEKILSEEECKTAVAALGMAFAHRTNNAGEPSGCFQGVRGRGWYNRNHVGAARRNIRPICKVGSLLMGSTLNTLSAPMEKTPAPTVATKVTATTTTTTNTTEVTATTTTTTTITTEVTATTTTTTTITAEAPTLAPTPTVNTDRSNALVLTLPLRAVMAAAALPLVAAGA
uniref:Uncharacterized protein n=1 Tax=Pyrodinium bahamense TaxID=73915 RepID=A0A7S0AQ33_9DINO